LAKTLIIAAVSSRAYVQAAVAYGYEVIALDAFIDAETKAIAKQTIKLKFDDFVLDEAYFKQVFLALDLSNIEGLLYGSLFDSCPDVLDWVAKQVSVIGNSADVLRRTKNFSFFALLDDLNILHPEVQISFPDHSEENQPENWLSKQIGGCGGMHIEPAFAEKPDCYFQKKLVGMSISMLFVADGNTAHLIGFNRQLAAPAKNLPYRFAGAVGNVALQPNIQEVFERSAQKLTSALGLRGVCSLDAVVGDDSVSGENVSVLELNPRLSATFHLYENLLPLHIKTCAGGLGRVLPSANTSNAQCILYADEALTISKNFAWPGWVVDIPTAQSHDSDIKTNAKISQHMPICSVLANADNAETAHVLVLQRAQQLTEMLKRQQNDRI
jgi:uncharacterized protein